MQTIKEAAADVNHKKIDNKLNARYEKYKGILKNLTMMNDVTAWCGMQTGNSLM